MGVALKKTKDYIYAAFFLKDRVQKFPGGLAVKDPALSVLGDEFNPWPRNFHMPQVCGQK